MKQVRYACTHCGKKFEAEEKEVLECPACFWSTSVKREDEAGIPLPSSPEKRSIKPALSLSLPAIPWKPVAAVAILVLGAFLLFKGVTYFLGLVQKNMLSPSSVQTPSNTVSLPMLSPGDQNILNRRVQISADRNPSEEEQKILDVRASFKLGFSEKLPSQAWTFENFEEMIRQQEQFFKVPLPGSYKGKLKDHFKKTYLPAAEAFKNGDLIRARNGWVESLAVPIYGGNVQKHRGVALTMIKPYINDTLSKIGTINSALVEKKIREQEQEVAAQYQKFTSLIEQKNWQNALNVAEDIRKKLEAFSQPQPSGGAIDYPPASIANVDGDIQNTLRGMLQVPPPATSDLEPLQQDILTKRVLIESFIPEKLSARQMIYDAALENIGRGEWEEAEKKLRELDTPPEFLRDAAEKINMIKRLKTQTPHETD